MKNTNFRELGSLRDWLYEGAMNQRDWELKKCGDEIMKSTVLGLSNKRLAAFQCKDLM